MTAATKLTPHFRASEFQCRCHRPQCDAVPMDPAFMELLETLRVQYGYALPVTSGSRCRYWNSHPDVGGAPNSQHLFGKAADLWLPNREAILTVAALAEDLGFGGIGAGLFHLLHVDTGPANRRWIYQTK